LVVDKVDKKDKPMVALGVAVIVIGVLAFVWFLPVSSEPIYADYTHWGPHPGCSGYCEDEYDENFWGIPWDNLTLRQQYEIMGASGCCIYHEDPYPLKGGHAYYNAFGIELYREWEWIS
jgi:hypothetical protein